MITVLKLINIEMERLGINYLYDDWTSKVKLPYAVGELSEVATLFEDGKREFSFTLTCEDIKSYTNLFNISETLRNTYKHNKKFVIDNKSIVISYDNTLTIPIEVEDLKRLQINMSIYLWEDD